MTSGSSGNSLSVDPEALRSVGTHLEGLGSQAKQILDRLTEVMAQQGNCWGTDQAGEQFAKTFEPSAHQDVEGLRTLASNLNQLGEGTVNLVDTYEQQDAVSTTEMARAVPEFAAPMTTTPGTTAGPPAAVAAPSIGPIANRVAAQQNSPGSLVSGRPASVQQPARPVRSATPPQQPVSRPQPSSQQPSSQQPSSAPQQASSNRGGTDRPPNTPGTRTPATPSEANRAAPPGSDAAGASPWSKSDGSKNSAGTPWSDGGSGRPGGSSARPPRVSPPEDDESPPRRPPGSPGAEKKRRSSASARSDESPNARIARELAERHGIAVQGFTLPGVDEETVREFAAAVDDMLAKYPASGLRGVGIADLGGAAAQTEVDEGAFILLALAAALDPEGYARNIFAATESGHLVRGSEQRPVYSTIVREFGRVLDVATGLRARSAAQKTLITQYLRVVAPEYQRYSLGRITAGYRDWRGQLCGCCFLGGQFDAGSAVAEAFLETELHGEQAGEQAACLHRMLVAMAPEATTPSEL
ncbi:uncharacterized protein YukE [Nocardia sp. GAS34]|uniref:WXG100 family type VII secretion target n=1 Tax=unclassified Nocardia TaxID=2637762 RepID=UPI003D254269